MSLIFSQGLALARIRFLPWDFSISAPRGFDIIRCRRYDEGVMPSTTFTAHFHAGAYKKER